MGYRTAELAQVVGLSERQVRSYVYRGLLAPDRGARREYQYSFQDLVVLRVGSRLARAKIPLRRIAAALMTLRSQLPDGTPLSAVDVDAFGDTVLVRDPDGVWDPESGQRYFGFALGGSPNVTKEQTASPLPVVVPLPLRARRVVQTDVEPAAWYERALAAEDAGDWKQAAHAYRTVLALDPSDSDARANLGRMLHEAGQVAEAEAEFRLALEHDPAHATAAFNLGVALEDRTQLEQAEASYRRAIRLDPDLAVAHYNLAGVLEARGEGAAALRHLAEYRRLVAGV